MNLAVHTDSSLRGEKMKTSEKVKIFTLFATLFVIISISCSSSAKATKPASTGGQEQVVATSTLKAVSTLGPTNIPKPTNTPQPTSTPGPTNTPKPTSTPKPTETLEPTATPTTAPIGFSRSYPYPRSEIASVPNWDVQILEVKRGEEAWKDLKAANMFNEVAPEGMEYILVKLHVKSKYTDADEHSIDGCSFDVTGNHLILYTCSMAMVVEPEPQLDARLFTGGEAEGWSAYLVAQGEGNLLLVVHEIFSFDESDIRYIALDEGATISISPELSNIKPTDLGKERSNPAPRAETIITKGWEVSVIDEVRGNEAWKMVKEANQFNDPPAEGMEYIAVKVHVRYIGTEDKAENIDESFFTATGGANVLYDRPSVVDPEPSLDVYLYPGGEYEGWIVVQAAKGEGNLMLVIEKTFSFDENTIRYIALDEGASVSVSPELSSIKSTDLGKERSNPAPRSEKIITEDWEVSLVDVVRGDEAWKMAQEANQFNDPPDEGMEYIAVKVHVRYIGTEDKAENIDESFFTTTGGANVLYDRPSVVDPEPSLDVYLYPGGEYEGWIIVQAAKGETEVVLVFEPLFDFSGDNKRFISLEP
jgi:hypothetical protein